MQWKKIGPNTIQTRVNSPLLLLERVTILFRIKLDGRQVGEDLYNKAIPEYGYTREFEIQGHTVWFTQDSDDDYVEIVIKDGSVAPEFLNKLKTLLEELPE